VRAAGARTVAAIASHTHRVSPRHTPRRHARRSVWRRGPVRTARAARTAAHRRRVERRRRSVRERDVTQHRCHTVTTALRTWCAAVRWPARSTYLRRDHTVNKQTIQHNHTLTRRRAVCQPDRRHSVAARMPDQRRAAAKCAVARYGGKRRRPERRGGGGCRQTVTRHTHESPHTHTVLVRTCLTPTLSHCQRRRARAAGVCC
jgi:hypothetical protein